LKGKKVKSVKGRKGLKGKEGKNVGKRGTGKEKKGRK